MTIEVRLIDFDRSFKKGVYYLAKTINKCITRNIDDDQRAP